MLVKIVFFISLGILWDSLNLSQRYLSYIKDDNSPIVYFAFEKKRDLVPKQK